MAYSSPEMTEEDQTPPPVAADRRGRSFRCCSPSSPVDPQQTGAELPATLAEGFWPDRDAER